MHFLKKPLVDLVRIFENYYDAGLVSGHDSLEHPAIGEFDLIVDGKKIRAKEKVGLADRNQPEVQANQDDSPHYKSHVQAYYQHRNAARHQTY